MAINTQLFYLGNEIVRIAKKFENTFPKTGPLGRNELGDCFMELLNLMNKIRLAIQEGDDVREAWCIKVLCTTKEVLEIKEKMDSMNLQYEDLKMISKTEE